MSANGPRVTIRLCDADLNLIFQSCTITAGGDHGRADVSTLMKLGKIFEYLDHWGYIERAAEYDSDGGVETQRAVLVEREYHLPPVAYEYIRNVVSKSCEWEVEAWVISGLARLRKVFKFDLPGLAGWDLDENNPADTNQHRQGPEAASGRNLDESRDGAAAGSQPEKQLANAS